MVRATVRVGLLCVTFTTVSVAAMGQETLPELVRRTGQPVEIERMPELVPFTFQELTEKADLIVFGTARPVAVSLSDDGRALFTDYSLSPIRVLCERTPRPATETDQPLVVRRWGGTTVINAIPVVVKEKYAPPFEHASAVVVWLVRERGRATYRLVSEVHGVIGVTDGVLQLWARPELYATDVTWNRLRGASVKQLALELSRIGR